MVHHKHGDRYSLNPPLRAPIQWNMALLDIRWHFRAQFSFIQHFSDDLDLAVCPLAGDLGRHAPAPVSVTLHRDISDGVLYHRDNDCSGVFTCMGKLGTNSRLGTMDSRLCNFRYMCCQFPVSFVSITSTGFHRVFGSSSWSSFLLSLSWANLAVGP